MTKLKTEKSHARIINIFFSFTF